MGVRKLPKHLEKMISEIPDKRRVAFYKSMKKSALKEKKKMVKKGYKLKHRKRGYSYWVKK